MSGPNKYDTTASNHYYVSSCSSCESPWIILKRNQH